MMSKRACFKYRIAQAPHSESLTKTRAPGTGKIRRSERGNKSHRDSDRGRWDRSNKRSASTQSSQQRWRRQLNPSPYPCRQQRIPITSARLTYPSTSQKWTASVLAGFMLSMHGTVRQSRDFWPRKAADDRL